MTITFGAFALRLVLLDRFPFREDEAAYAFWALHGWLEDPMFLEVWPDKPPVYLWMLGGAFRLFGVSEAGARWVNVAASTLAIPVIAATARRLWGRRAAVLAAMMLALSPYAISFAPTAYTDPVLVLAGMSALCAAAYGRPLWAGVFLGVAVMTKQQGVLYAPLVAGMLLAHRDAVWRRRMIGGAAVRRLALLAGGVALVVLPIFYWDSLRWMVAPSPWDLSVRNYAALALAAPPEWPARAAEWAPLLVNLAASWAAWAALVGLLLGGAVVAYQERNAKGGTAWTGAAVMLIGLWSAAFIGLHVVTTVQPWDRYLLPLAPMLALAAGWAAGKLGRSVTAGQAAVALAAGALLWAGPAMDAAQGRLPMGGDHGDYAGLTEAIGAVQLESAGPFVLYHRALGSHYRFYLYDQMSSDRVHAELRWFPSSVYLADNAAKTPYPRLFLIEPEWAPLADLGPQLAMRGLGLERRGAYERFTVWEIAGEPQHYCSWCASRPESPWRVLSGVPSAATPVQ